MSGQNVGHQIANAWRLHREGDNASAVTEFKKITDSASKNIDAFYGLGLALRANGDIEGAAKAFQTSYELTTEALTSFRKVAEAEGTVGNNLTMTEDDRYMMLTRMVKQRLAEVGVTVN